MRKTKFGELIIFQLKPDLSRRERTKFFREFYGYKDKSRFGDYTYQRKGFLTNTHYIHLNRGAIIVAKGNKHKLISFLQKKAKIKVRRIRLTPGDQIKLFGRV